MEEGQKGPGEEPEEEMEEQEVLLQQHWEDGGVGHGLGPVWGDEEGGDEEGGDEDSFR